MTTLESTSGWTTWELTKQLNVNKLACNRRETLTSLATIVETAPPYPNDVPGSFSATQRSRTNQQSNTNPTSSILQATFASRDQPLGQPEGERTS